MKADGLCKGRINLDLWFDPEHFPEAISICQQCPLQAACYLMAIDNDEKYGVFGGTTPSERGHKHDEDGSDA